MKNKKIFEIKIISGQQFPVKRDIVNDISDPFVSISIFGVKSDMCEQKTHTISNNGFNPIWDEKFTFTINCPELAFVKFTVKDKDIGKDQIIGEYAIRFENIRQGKLSSWVIKIHWIQLKCFFLVLGFRHLKLNNKESKGTLFVAIRIKPFESLTELLAKEDIKKQQTIQTSL